MANEVISNIILINAPAGSGKTTSIRSRLKHISLEEAKSKILCITYTNRAAEELQKDLDNKNVYVSTIHSYINDLISPFFSEKEVIEIYWSLFKNKINERILNIDNDDHIKESNQKYIDICGGLSEDIVKSNLTNIFYNQTPFTSLFYGGLSHDDLLSFAYKLTEKHPVILKKIYSKYNYIFIDEYQDTSADVLRLFYNAVRNREVKLYLLGDRMQQIYKNYDGTFENEFKTFDTSEKLIVNYRSLPPIISILNKLYNDETFNQSPSETNKDATSDFNPGIVIASNMNDAIKKAQTKSSNTLVLYLFNREKYAEIGAETLYRSFNLMEKYSFGRRYSPTDVLSDLTEDNPDLLMKFLFVIYRIVKYYSNENYGSVISICKKQNKLFNQAFIKVSSHKDKVRLKDAFDKFVELYFKDETKISDVMAKLVDLNISSEEVMLKFTENFEYNDVFNVSVKELHSLACYLDSPTISTQHGVKGESHTSVVFVANDSNTNPIVRMYDFYKLWATIDFSLSEIEELYYSYLKEVNILVTTLGMKTDDLNAVNHNNNETNKTILREASKKVLELFGNNEIFEFIYKKDYEMYLANQNVGNAKQTFKTTKLYGVLSAYKLFYVGCSRARENLTIVVDSSKVANFKDAFVKKAKDTGFAISEE